MRLPHAGDAVTGVRFRDPRRLTDSAVSGSMCRVMWHMMTHTYPNTMANKAYADNFDLCQLQYPSLPWVRYITQSGDIAVRLPEVQ